MKKIFSAMALILLLATNANAQFTKNPIVQDDGVKVNGGRIFNFATGITAVYNSSTGAYDITGTGSGGSGSTIIVQEGDVTSGTTSDTIDFRSGFDVSESPTREQNITLDLSEVLTGAVTSDTSNVTYLDGSSSNITNTGTLSATTPVNVSGARKVLGGAAVITIDNAAADGATKGAATFTASDFNASSGNISIDYTNGTAATSGNKGFLTSTDWTTFNNKVGTVGSCTSTSCFIDGSADATLIFEGATSNAFEITLQADDPSADSTIHIPADKDGTLAITTGGLTTGNCVSIDSTGRFVDAGGACSSTSGTTDGGTVVYVTSNTDDFAVGGTNDTTAGIFMDESAETVKAQNGFIVGDGTDNDTDVFTVNIAGTDIKLVYDSATGQLQINAPLNVTVVGKTSLNGGLETNTGVGATSIYDVDLGSGGIAGLFHLDAAGDYITMGDNSGNNMVISGGGETAFNGDAYLQFPTTDSTALAVDGAPQFYANKWASGHGAIQFNDHTSTVDTVATLASDTPSNGQVPTFNTGGTITWETPAGSGDITSVGDVASGAAFDGTQGTTLTFNDSDGDQTISYDTTNNKFVISDNVSIGSAGVDLTTDGDGAITFLGLGNGSDEDLTLNFDDTSNIIVASTSTGVTTIDTTTIGFDLDSSSLVLPSSTSLPAGCVTGQLYMDTDATSGQRLYACQSLNTWVKQGDGGGGSSTQSLQLPAQSAKLVGAFVTASISGLDTAAESASINAGDGPWDILFDATTDEAVVWQGQLPSNWTGHGTFVVPYSMASATTLEVEGELAIMCISPGDSADINTASFTASTNVVDTVAGTAGYMKALTFTVTDDTCAAGDTIFWYFSFDSNDAVNDDATGDREVYTPIYHYTSS